MNITECRLQTEGDLSFRIQKAYFESGAEKRSKAVLIIKFAGFHGEGSGGNRNSEFMKTVISASLGLFLSDMLILDLTELKYEFGDSLASVLDIPSGIKSRDYETVLAVSDLCRKGLLSLMEFTQVSFRTFSGSDEALNYFSGLKI
ncbi:MAG TPA: hypothetical protein PKK05_06650 [Leptospiraceae bacterium]|nr:hypothetical protein [Leptospiraceae bacterium]